MLRNTSSGYGAIAIVFHWTMAVLILALVGLGLYMTGLEQTDPSLYPLYQLHKSLGLTALALAVLRLAWRVINPSPRLPQTMSRIERVAAHLGHAGLYALMLAIPLSGWLMVSASPWGIPTVIFNLFTVPHLPVPEALGDKAAAEAVLKGVHEILGWSLIVLVGLHVAAALKHHFISRDTVFKRMTSLKPATESR
ncbi:cytochrome b [Rhizobiales bacterium]|uniref:cytochrome b n=1 Tax=Hongsoonwoonella zoysiae TaxID=2821844 RepID=UPI00155FD72A|nr:cytochrome b [Hongsoonwoonella zoysiae]NRG18468.1 cytochrome b [Hongsoonwoonella zoysiae]